MVSDVTGNEEQTKARIKDGSGNETEAFRLWQVGVVGKDTDIEGANQIHKEGPHGENSHKWDLFIKGDMRSLVAYIYENEVNTCDKTTALNIYSDDIWSKETLFCNEFKYINVASTYEQHE